MARLRRRRRLPLVPSYVEDAELIETHAIAIDSAPNTVTQITQAGSGTLEVVSSTNPTGISQALSAIISQAKAPDELCGDGVDNDCDGTVDETPDCS